MSDFISISTPKPIIGILTCGCMQHRQYVPQTYIHAVNASGGIPVLIPFTKTECEFCALASLCHGFLYCGGDDVTPLLFNQEPLSLSGATNFTVDKFQILFMEYLLTLEKPVFAICRGMQIMNIAKNGQIYQDISYKETPSLCHMQNSDSRSDVSHKIIIQPDTKLFELLGDNVYTNSYHHQSISILGDHIIASARTSDNVIEAIEIDNHPFAIGVQWHPECMYHTSRKMRDLFFAFMNACVTY